MEITRNQILNNDSEIYDDFELHQLTVSLDVGDTVDIVINSEVVASFVGKYIKSHIDLKYQAKSEKKTPTKLEQFDYQIAKLQRQKAEEEAKERI